jgi:hypothetical protein
MEQEEVKVVISRALERAYYLDNAENSIPTLRCLLDNPQRTELEKVVSDLLESNNPDEHVLAFLLQAVLQSNLQAPASIAWRDVALDIRESQSTLVQYMYALGRVIEDWKDCDSMRDKLGEMHDSIREWAGSMGSAVYHMREENWIEAKVEIERAYFSSQLRAIDELKRFREDPLQADAIERLRGSTKQFRETILGYPSRMSIPRDRLQTILDVQSIYLRLHEIRHENPRLQAVSYPIEKLGDAIDYLLQAETPVQTANYEIGLATGNLRRSIPNIAHDATEKELLALADKLDIIFSNLPATPWPVKDYGHPDVESRFGSET